MMWNNIYMNIIQRYGYELWVSNVILRNNKWKFLKQFYQKTSFLNIRLRYTAMLLVIYQNDC